ncbi:SMODS and SLOG-associating 2TM effector domain family 5 [compost metagenome]
MSVALLGVSLAVSNRDFRGRAILMRNNYLKLQKLYRDIPVSTTPSADHQTRYDELLAEAENHREIDDRIARAFSSGLTSRHPTLSENLHAICWLAVRALITIALYIAPIIVAIYAWKHQ